MSETRRMTENDRQLIEMLLVESPQEINHLVETLGVTATAVRQRLGRLMSAGMVERTTLSSGRGRPVHQYSLTEQGRLSGGNNLADLAVALWQQIQQIPDAAIRENVVSGAIDRLADKYNAEVSGETAAQRMASMSQVFGQRDLPVKFEHDEGGLPVMTVTGCFYPGLSESGNDICEFEQRVLKQVVGDDVHLCTCQRQGGACCSFQAGQIETENLSKVTS